MKSFILWILKESALQTSERRQTIRREWKNENRQNLQTKREPYFFEMCGLCSAHFFNFNNDRKIDERSLCYLLLKKCTCETRLNVRIRIIIFPFDNFLIVQFTVRKWIQKGRGTNWLFVFVQSRNGVCAEFDNCFSSLIFTVKGLMNWLFVLFWEFEFTVGFVEPWVKIFWWKVTVISDVIFDVVSDGKRKVFEFWNMLLDWSELSSGRLNVALKTTNCQKDLSNHL